MKKRIAAIIITAAASSESAAENLQEGIRLKLVETNSDRLEVTPGDPFDYNISLKNYGTGIPIKSAVNEARS